MNLAARLIDAMIEWIDQEVPPGGHVQLDEVLSQLSVFNRLAIESVVIPEGQQSSLSPEQNVRVSQVIGSGLAAAAAMIDKLDRENRAEHLKVVGDE